MRAVQVPCTELLSFSSSSSEARSAILSISQQGNKTWGDALHYQLQAEEPCLTHTSQSGFPGPGVLEWRSYIPLPVRPPFFMLPLVCLVPLHTALWVCPWELSLVPITVLPAWPVACVCVY